ncbi:MAG TPA: hypothetical protein VN799_09150 [Acidimicrobiales bacterium]|nr:hypothetical protein [Acidimicrobiales bacterium]
MDRRTAILSGAGVVAALVTACGSTSGPGGGAVDLTFSKHGRLTGTLGGRPVNLSGAVPASSGSVGGTVTGESVDGTWRIGDQNAASPSTVPVNLEGRFAGRPVVLAATLLLMSNFLFDSGTVSGTIGGRPVRAEATHAPGESSSSVNVAGSFAGTAFSFYGTIAGDLGSGLVRGTVGPKAISLEARVHGGAIRLTGDYEGPSTLFVLTAGTLIYFLGGIYA